MATTIDWTDAAGNSVALTFDATKTQGYEHPAEITEHPVETGAAVADHIRPGNPTYTIEGIITNAPIVVPGTQMSGVTQALQTVALPGGGSVSLLQWSGDFNRVRACDEILAALVDAGTLVRLTSTLRFTDNLAIARYKAEKSGTGDAVNVTMELRRVRLVSTARAPVPAVRRAQVSAQRGAQPVDDRSTAARLADGSAPVSAERARARADARRRNGGGQ